MTASECVASPRRLHGRARARRGVQGYSAIELLATIGLLGIVTAMAIPHFDSRRMQINSAQRLLIANLRLARSSAITKSVHFRVDFPAASQVRIQRLIQVGAEWQVDPDGVQTMSLPTGTALPSSLVGTSIEYNTRGMAIDLAAPRRIDVTDTFGVTKSLQAWPSGQVNEL